MKIYLSILSCLLILCSCNSITYNREFYSERKVRLLENENYKDEMKICLYNNSEYELLVPLSKIKKYVEIRNNDEKQRIDVYLNKLLKFNHSGDIFEDSNFIFYNISTDIIEFFPDTLFCISSSMFFESGDYLIRSKKDMTFIHFVNVEIEYGWIPIGITRYGNVLVRIGKKYFYEEHAVNHQL